MGRPPTTPESEGAAQADDWRESLSAAAAALSQPLEDMEEAAGCLRLHFDIDGQRLTIRVVPLSEGEPSFATTGKFGVSYEGSDLPPAGLETLKQLTGVVRRLEERMPDTFEGVQDEASDGGEGEEAAAERPSFFTNSRMERFHKRWRRSLDWWKFYYPQMHNYQVQELVKNVALVHHATLECKFSMASHSHSSLAFFSDLHVERMASGRCNVDSFLHAGDVATGRTGDKLADAVEKAASLPGIEHVIVMTTCLPDLIGDNPLPILGKIEEKHGVRCYWSGKSMDHQFSAEPIYRDALASIGLGSRRQADHVVLGGVARPHQADELARRLEAHFGLTTAGSIFPSVDLSKGADLGTASHLVWVDAHGWTDTLESLIRDEISLVRPPPPYGIEATVHWLEAVGAALGRDVSEAAIHQALEDDFGAELAELRERCREHRVALIGDRLDLMMLTAPSQFCSLSVAQLLSEMGFDLRLLLHAPEGSLPEFDTVSEAAVSVFETREELDTLLGEDISLAYSSFRSDFRLLRRGIVTFDEQVFEPGVEGFMRASKTLIDSCRSAPFRGFRALLGEPTARP